MIHSKVADLVEKDRAVVGETEIAATVARRAGEAALHMAEELTFKQLGRNGRHVDGDEGLFRSWAEPVDGAGKELFPCAWFPEQQDGQRRLRAFLHVLKQPKQGAISGDDAESAGFGLKPVEFRISDRVGYGACRPEIAELLFQFPKVSTSILLLTLRFSDLVSQ